MTRSPRRLTRHVRDAVGEHVRDLPIQAARLAMFGIGRALLLGDRVSKDYKELRGSGPRPVLQRLRGDVEGLALRTLSRVVERATGSAGPSPTVPTPEPQTPAARPSAEVSRPLAAEPEIAVGKPTTGRGGAGATATATAPARPGDGARTEVTEPVSGPEPDTAREPGAVADALSAARPAAPREEATAPVSEAGSGTWPEGRPGTAAATAPEVKAAPEPAAAPRAEDEAPGPEETPGPKAPSRPATAVILVETLPVPNYDEASLASLRARLRHLSAEQVGMLRAYERQNAARPAVLRMYENRIAKLADEA